EHAVDCRTPPHERIDDIVQTLRQAARRTPRGAWIVGQGNLLQEMKLRDKRYPTAADLDRASAEHPVVLRCSVHAVVLNTLALRLCGITAETGDPPGGYLDRDPHTGQPTGMTRDMAHHLPLPRTTRDQLRQAFVRAGRRMFLAEGVTSVRAMSGSRAGLEVLGSR